MSKFCKACGQEIPEDLLKAREEWRIQKIKTAFDERRERGLNIGRPSKVDFDVMESLLARGFSDEETASILGITVKTLRRLKVEHEQKSK